MEIKQEVREFGVSNDVTNRDDDPQRSTLSWMSPRSIEESIFGGHFSPVEDAICQRRKEFTEELRNFATRYDAHRSFLYDDFDDENNQIASNIDAFRASIIFSINEWVVETKSKHYIKIW